ncbi:MAG TPA: DUF885 domain-containing protein [Pseudomonadales bacterium]
MKHFVLVPALALLVGCSEPAPQQEVPPSNDLQAAVEQESARLTAWLDEQFRQELEFSPEWKTQLGDKSDYDKLDDVSEEEYGRQLQWRRDSVARMRAEFPNYARLDEEAKTSYDLWIYALEQAERNMPFIRHGFIFGRGGPHASLPNFLINFHLVDDAGDMQAYIARLNAVDEVMRTYLDRARSAVEDGIRGPQWNYDFAIGEIDRVLAGAPFSEQGTSPLWSDVQAKVAALREAGMISDEEAAAFAEDARTALVDAIQPAYAEVRAWLAADRANARTEDLGAWALPGGEVFYDARLFANTTQEMTADEVHAIGLAEVARLRGEMEALKASVGFDGTLQEFFAFMREDDQFYFGNNDEDREAYLQLARDYLGKIERKLPEFFGILPKAGLEVRRVEAFREQPGGAQHYFAGTPDGSRNGIFYAHLSDMRAMPKYTLEAIAYHEGNPGHHMQISIAQELTGLPRFRTQYFYTAYVEGWGLYAEALGKDMGGYADPYSDFGRLSAEIWRAIRLVVDTGIHAKRWSQEEAVQYFLDNSPQPEATVRSEIERYIITPGQATAYKIGMLKIQELRTRAEDALGEGFDIRGFHDTVLGGGALPLPVLEAKVVRWIEREQRRRGLPAARDSMLNPTAVPQ